VSNVGSGTNATSEKVMRSIPNEVIRFFFNWPNHSSCSMAMRIIQHLTEMSTRNLLVVKDKHVRLITSLPSVIEFSGKCMRLNMSQSYRSTQPVIMDIFTFLLLHLWHIFPYFFISLCYLKWTASVV
jgi:hypothetical protein